MAHSSLSGPNYYKRGTVEVWDFIRDQRLNYHLGNAIKYICRAGHKDSKVDDLKKAIHYITNELENTIVADATSERVSEGVQRLQLPHPFSTEYTTDFDR